jgi:hypothetical protein
MLTPRLKAQYFLRDRLSSASETADLLPLRPGYVLASNVTVQGRFLRGATELHHDAPDFLREVGMTNQSDSQTGIQSPLVRLAQRDDVGLIERSNQGPDNLVQTRSG